MRAPACSLCIPLKLLLLSEACCCLYQSIFWWQQISSCDGFVQRSPVYRTSRAPSSLDDTDIEIGNNLDTVKLLTTSAIFDCGTEDGLTALSILYDMCERRLPFDFDSFFIRRAKERTANQDSKNCTKYASNSPDQGEKVISRITKFLPEKTTKEFIDSVRVMEEQGWMSFLGWVFLDEHYWMKSLG